MKGWSYDHKNLIENNNIQNIRPLIRISECSYEHKKKKN